jgi:hypothetical protein
MFGTRETQQRLRPPAPTGSVGAAEMRRRRVVWVGRLDGCVVRSQV